MASASQSERSTLLGKAPDITAQQHTRRYESTSTSRFEENEADDAQSVFSHVSLDATPTYGRLVGSHILSLLPGIALQLATVMLAFHAPCHIQYEPEDQPSDRKVCRRLLSDWMSLIAFTLGLLSWLAAYSFRPALWRVVEWSSWILQSCLGREAEPEQDDSRSPSRRPRSSSDIISTLFFVLLRTTILESIRMLNVIVINAVLFAGLAHLRDQHKAGAIEAGPTHPHWFLHWYDPRFTVGLWVAIGWCTTEFVVSTFQMFDRLSLYKPLFGQASLEEENNIPAASNYTPHASSFADNMSGGDYLSDSAATVRAHSRTAITSKNDSQANGHQEDKQGNLSSRYRQRRAQGEESGFSIVDAVEEQEMNRLRDQLDDEMDMLLKARLRDELQQTLGQPLTEVPIVLCALWRIDGWLWNLGSTLLMSASVALAQGALNEEIPRLFPPFRLVKTTLFVLIALHSIFTSMWTLSLGLLGFAFVTYTSMLGGLGLCISALFRWGLLI